MRIKKELKFLTVAACTPPIKVANPKYNIEQIIKLSMDACNNYNADLVVFPELSITGYTCGDLFLQSTLIDSAKKELLTFVGTTKVDKTLNGTIFVLGVPLRKDNQLFNCAVYIQNGRILGVVPKMYIPNYNEFYEKRWFSSGNERFSDDILIDDKLYPFGDNLLFKNDESGICIGTDICEDLWMPNAPSNKLSVLGANIIVNLSASNELISKAEYRRNLVKMQSAKCICGYVYASAGVMESTTDVVFSGHKMIAANGSILVENRYNNDIIASVIDLEKLENDRCRFETYHEIAKTNKIRFVDIPDTIYKYVYEDDFIKNMFVDAYPFVPKNVEHRKERCKEILTIQANGLAMRLLKANINKIVIGISGGLDSTLALLVAVNAMKILNYPMTNIIGITMPGYGTTNRTLDNSIELMNLLGITYRKVSIVPICDLQFKAIQHNKEVFDITYENVQARERTEILMNTANKEGGIVLGTGDLSELALGWCTYNGDHMSMYAVNTSIPKTLVKYLINSVAIEYDTGGNKKVAEVLEDICDTPISPELLPTDKDGNMVQTTEGTIGKYDLHDFFLYNMLRNCFGPKKIYYLAKKAFVEVSDEEILSTMKTFYKRFFTQQFKRSCLPDGPKVGSVAVSPRGDLRMPSDASADIWLNDLEDIKI